jgi:hypothetical protein
MMYFIVASKLSFPWFDNNHRVRFNKQRSDQNRETFLEQKRWFLLVDGQVTGPFADRDLETQLSSGTLKPSAEGTEPLIWGRGQGEWMTPDRWRAALAALNAQEALETQKSRQWRMRVQDKELSPMNLEELIEQLKDFSDLSPVRVWTEGFEDWKEVFHVQKIMTELGVSRRQHARVPIMGTLKCETPLGIVNAKVISISEGGLGVTGVTGLHVGDKVRGNMTSPNLFVPINSTVEIVYLGGDGYAGLRFLGLPPEGRSAIIEYVKKFQQVQK